MSLIGLCCGGALVAAGAATAGAAVGGSATWPFLTAGVALLTAAWLVHRRTTRQGCCPPPERHPDDQDGPSTNQGRAITCL